MGYRHLAWLCALTLAGCPANAPSEPDAEPASDSATETATDANPATDASDRMAIGYVTDKAAVDEVVAPFLTDEWVAGMVVGIVTPDDAKVYGYGRVGGPGDGRTPDGDTIFEIGSVSKVFNTMLLARAVEQGELESGTPLQDLLAAEDDLKGTGGSAVTLEHLAAHTSGLPRIPSNFEPADISNPYADYGLDLAMAFLRRHEPVRAPGESYEYSNLGAGLLGHGLARRAGSSWEELVRTRIAEPLGMVDTTVTLDEAQQARFAQPHDADLNPVPAWDFDVLAGAGALRSTANDLIKLLQVALGHTESPWGTTLATMAHPLAETGDGGLVGLGWHLARSGLVWHNGGTSGSHSFIGYDKDEKFGVVVLSNTGTFQVDAVARAMLRVIANKRRQLRLPPLVAVKEAVLERYPGTYPLDDSDVAVVTREGGKLFIRIEGQPRFRVYPTDDTTFLYRVVPARVVFDGDGGLVFHQGDERVAGKRAEKTETEQ